MANNMNVSVTLRLVDQLTGNLRGVVNGLQQVGKAAQDLNRSAVGVGMSTQLNRVHGQIRGLIGEALNLGNQFNQLNRSMSGGSGGSSFGQRQIADLRQVLQLQQQVIANNGRMLTGGGGGGRRGPGGGGGSGGLLGRSGFSPNASIQDRLQYRGVNFMERSIGEGILQSDQAQTRLRLLNLSPETIGQANAMAAGYARMFPTLTKSDILETFGEIVTQFQTDQEAFTFLPHLLRVQELDVLQGRDRTGSRDGMLRLLRGIGLSGRLTDAEGNLSEQEAAGFLDAYTRARIIGGADVNPDQAFQFVKYMKSMGQTINTEALLEGFIAMPDLRGSTYGNQLNMLTRQLAGGRSTKEALQAQALAGLRTGRIEPDHAAGPNKFKGGPLVDSELMRQNPSEWFRRHIMGPNGFLRHQGLDPLRSSPAAIADVLAPLFSNASAENIANMIVNQQQEWQNQIARALRLNVDKEFTDQLSRSSLWTGLQQARAQIINTLTSVGDSFKDILLPPLFKFSEALQFVAEKLDPRTGNPYLKFGLVGGAGVGGFMLLRRLMAGMGGTGRTLLGLGLGGLVGGGVSDALMGGLMARGLGGGGATAAAGAAGAAAAASWRARFLRGLWAIPVGILRMGLWGVAFSGIAAIVDNWQAVSERLKAIWADLSSALPTFLGGGGGGYMAFARGPNVTETGNDLEAWLQGVDRSIKEWAQGTQLGQWMQQNGWATTEQQRLDQDAQRTLALGYGNPTAGAPVPVTVVGKGTTQPINVQVIVNVAQTNASPEAIGEAAGNAVGSRLRGALSDAPSAVD